MNTSEAHPLQYSDFFIAVAIWALLILRFGYCFGTGDHVELLPYTKFLADPTLYPHDFFIQSLHATIPNERTVFANLLLPFVHHLELTLFCLHLLTTVTLLLGLRKVASFYMSTFPAWLGILVSVFVLNDKALGNVDLYTPSVQATDVACAIIAWAMVAFLRKRYWLFLILMIAATFIHVLEALDVMLLFSSILLLYTLMYKRMSFTKFFSLHALYFSTAGIYLVLILLGKSSVPSTLSNSTLFTILFEFRHPHHFIFSTFPLFNKLLFVGTTGAGLVYFYLQRSPLFYFFLFGCIGIIAYIIATDCFHFIPIANFQFYKVTQWMKVLGILSAVGLLFNFIPTFNAVKPSIIAVCAIVVIVFSFGSIYTNTSPFKVNYQFGAKLFVQPEIDIARKAKQCTAIDAVFVVPFATNEFKFWSERSAYIEFKANVRNKQFVGEWYRRIGEVYGVDTTDLHLGFEKHWTADRVYRERANSEFCLQWKREGVSHMLIDEHLTNPLLTLLDSNARYYIYKIN
jgi:hypothetical protein